MKDSRLVACALWLMHKPGEASNIVFRIVMYVEYKNKNKKGKRGKKESFLDFNSKCSSPHVGSSRCSFYLDFFGSISQSNLMASQLKSNKLDLFCFGPLPPFPSLPQLWCCI